jgi:hypothetical protein
MTNWGISEKERDAYRHSDEAATNAPAATREDRSRLMSLRRSAPKYFAAGTAGLFAFYEANAHGLTGQAVELVRNSVPDAGAIAAMVPDVTSHASQAVNNIGWTFANEPVIAMTAVLATSVTALVGGFVTVTYLRKARRLNAKKIQRK